MDCIISVGLTQISLVVVVSWSFAECLTAHALPLGLLYRDYSLVVFLHLVTTFVTRRAATSQKLRWRDLARGMTIVLLLLHIPLTILGTWSLLYTQPDLSVLFERTWGTVFFFTFALQVMVALSRMAEWIFHWKDWQRERVVLRQIIDGLDFLDFVFNESIYIEYNSTEIERPQVCRNRSIRSRARRQGQRRPQPQPQPPGAEGAGNTVAESSRRNNPQNPSGNIPEAHQNVDDAAEEDEEEGDYLETEPFHFQEGTAVCVWEKFERTPRSCIDKNHLCSVCLEDYSPDRLVARLTGCQHLFHASCMESWTRINPTCPNCRIQVIGMTILDSEHY